MTTTPEAIAFERGIRPVLPIMLPDKLDAILQFRPSPELQARIEELAGKSTEGKLTEAERAEYEGYVRANKFVAVLQRQGARDGRLIVGDESGDASRRSGPRRQPLRVLPASSG